MRAVIFRNGQVVYGVHSDLPDSPKQVIVESINREPLYIKPLSDHVHLVKFGDRDKVCLIVFRKDEHKRPLVVDLHGVKYDATVNRIWINIFTRLMTYDDNRLPNRVRNILTPITRQRCPEYFKDTFETDNGVFSYSVYKSLLTVHNHKGEGLVQINYVKLSRSIKDGLK